MFDVSTYNETSLSFSLLAEEACFIVLRLTRLNALGKENRYTSLLTHIHGCEEENWIGSREECVERSGRSLGHYATSTMRQTEFVFYIADTRVQGTHLI